MAKIISYQFVSAKVNHGTEEEPNIEQILSPAQIICETQAQYDANYPIAEREAVGEITVEGKFEPEQDNASTDDVLNALLGVTV